MHDVPLEFQFHKVRLKVNRIEQGISLPFLFQFHKVRLKVRPVRWFRFRFGRFNSIRYD